MEDIEKIIAQAKAEIEADDRLHKCSLCVWYDEEKKYCRRREMAVHSVYAPMCREYMTSEQALRVVALQEREKAQRELNRLLLKMDIMAYLINAAMAEMESIDTELEQSHQRLAKKDDACEKNHADCKRNRKRMVDAFKRMKYYMKNIDSEYRNYIEHYFSAVFGEPDGSFNAVEYDKSSVNSGMVRAFAAKFVDVSLNNGENCKAVFECMDAMTGSGLLNNKDFNNSLIR